MIPRNLLSVKNLSYDYNHSESVLQNISFDVHQGELIAILGPNGAGKTTLLKILTGLLETHVGQVIYRSKDLSNLTLQERSYRISYVAQSEEIFLPYTVKQIVMMGRAPYLGIMGFEKKEDLEIVHEAMSLTEVTEMANRSIQEISGGERQRVFLARALAQQTPVILLDEPTSHLDLHHQIHFFQLLKKLQSEKNLTIIATLHDLNLAALFADRCLILKRGCVMGYGKTSDTFQSELLSSVYDCSLSVTTLDGKKWVRPNLS